MTNNHSAGAPDYKVPGLERGLAILTLFNQRVRSLSAADIARRLGIPRSTAYRLVVTLEALGFLEASGNGHEYRLGRGVLRLGFEYLASQEMVDLCHPILAQLTTAIGYPCNLAIRDGRDVVYVARALAPNSLTGAMNVGARLPAHATLIGRLLLSELSLAELRALYPEEALEASSENTPRTVAALHQLLQQDRRQACLVGENYFENGYSSVAAPVRDHAQRIAAVISAIIPSSSIAPEQLEPLTSAVGGSAQQLSALLRRA